MGDALEGGSLISGELTREALKERVLVGDLAALLLEGVNSILQIILSCRLSESNDVFTRHWVSREL